MNISFSKIFDRRLYLIIAVSGLVGCGDSGVKKIHISGTATYQGQPIPLGKVVFQPDRRQGNTGPMGIALIENGRFKSMPDRGVVPGALQVTIYGHNGKNMSAEYRPYGDPMFSPYTTTVHLTKSSDEETFDVPKTNK